MKTNENNKDEAAGSIDEYYPLSGNDEEDFENEREGDQTYDTSTDEKNQSIFSEDHSFNSQRTSPVSSN